MHSDRPVGDLPDWFERDAIVYVPSAQSKRPSRRLILWGSGIAVMVIAGVVGLLLFNARDDADRHVGQVAATEVVETAAADADEASATPTEPTETPRPVDTAVGVLETLAVKGRAAATGYDRALFGQVWLDVDRNGCDTRNDILRRDLTGIYLKPDSNGCAVLTGVLDDPYTGRTIPFTRGQGTSLEVQIDHVVALSDAWHKGAFEWDSSKREAFANDPLELLAVDGPSNQSKSDGDAATWLPPYKSDRCRYVARQVAIKAKYDLWVTSAEHDAIARVLASCPDEPLPVPEEIRLG